MCHQVYFCDINVIISMLIPLSLSMSEVIQGILKWISIYYNHQQMEISMYLIFWLLYLWGLCSNLFLKRKIKLGFLPACNSSIQRKCQWDFKCCQSLSILIAYAYENMIPVRFSERELRKVVHIILMSISYPSNLNETAICVHYLSSP
jgi:hypothetical protein